VPALIQSARALVFPTWCESFGLPLAEALAMGAPAVAADIPACREVGGEVALYYAPGDARSMAHAIETLLTEDTRDRSAQGRAWAQRFSWRDNAVAVRQTLERAARGRG
jgi:glycosyltransferase involved in cell wall biosynthesis